MKNEKIRVSSMKIEVKPIKEAMKETIEAFKKIERGEDVRIRRVVFEDLDTLRSVLTKERVRLMHCVRVEKPESIYELAKNLDRNWRLVAKDVKLLNNVGLVKIKRKEKPREVIKPIVNFSRMDVSLSI